VDGLGSGFKVYPRVGETQPDRGAAIHGARAEDAAELGQQRVEARVDRGGVGLAPQGLGQLVAGDLAVTVDDQVGEQQPALAPGQHRIQALTVALDGSGPQIWMRTGCGDAKVTPISWQYAARGGQMPTTAGGSLVGGAG